MNHMGGKNAIVIGCGIGGISAARVLSDHFEQVTILDRDVLPESSQPRKGTPQAPHGHVMLKAGELAVEKLFPRFYEQLKASDEVPFIDSSDINWFHYGVWRMRIKANISKALTMRYYLEWKLRCRLLEDCPNVKIVQECSVTGFLTDAAKQRITGVQVHHKQSSEQQEELHADLIVDASGRSNQTPDKLAAIGFAKPEERFVKVNVGYASCLIRIAEGKELDYRLMSIYQVAPKGRKIGMLSAVEGNVWNLSLASYLGDYPPEETNGFVEYAKQLERPDIYEAAKDATFIGEIRSFRIAGSIRHYYEKLKHFPDGLVVLGDALCSFNPVYGQGMSMATMSATILDEVLREQQRQHPGTLNGLNKRYFKKVAKLVDVAWKNAITEDFRFPEAVGKRPPFTGLRNWYMGHLFELASVNTKICIQVMLVQNLVAQPSTLLAPYILWQVVKKILQGKRVTYQMLHPTEPATQEQLVTAGASKDA